MTVIDTSAAGASLKVNVEDSPSVRLRVMRIVKTHWPECVMSLDQNHDWLEVFFLSTLAMSDSWDDCGQTEDNRDHMLHVIHEKHRVTCSYATRANDAKTAKIAREIVQALQGTP